MRFHVAWDSIEKQNRALKLVSLGLFLFCIVLTFGFMSAALKEPLIIDRGCRSSVSQVSQSEPTSEEKAIFTREALKARFNSNANQNELLSTKQKQFRDKEQTELGKQKMTQAIFVNDVLIGKDGIKANVDRLISIGEIRSAFKFPLKIKIERVPRSKGNPYGLILTEVDPLTESKKEEN